VEDGLSDLTFDFLFSDRRSKTKKILLFFQEGQRTDRPTNSAFHVTRTTRQLTKAWFAVEVGLSQNH
jgi:hypothetical protein